MKTVMPLLGVIFMFLSVGSSFGEGTTNNDLGFSETNGFFKTVIDSKTGEFAITDPARQSVFFVDTNGNTVFSTNLLSYRGTFLIAGKREITSMELQGERLRITIGMHTYFFINPRNDSVEFFGSD